MASSLVQNNAISNELKEELVTLLSSNQLDCWFQPIVDFPNRAILGYEALVRGPKESPLHTPGALFATAEQFNLLRELEQECVINALQKFTEQQLPGKLFLNISATDFETLDNPDNKLSRMLTEHAQHLELVIEVSEKEPLTNYTRVREIADYCHSNGLLLAIDDLGSGYSGLRSWSEIRPEYVKVDMHFIRDIHKDNVKREFVSSICEISRGLNCQIIAEGIEHTKELDTLRSLGIKLGQGYLLSKPCALPPTDIAELIKPLGKSANVTTRHANTRPSDTVGDLLQKAAPLSPTVAAEDINDAFFRHPEISSIPIVEDERAIGLISRAQILELFSGRFSHPLYGHKPVRELMNTQPVIVDHETRLEEVSQRITDNEQVDLNNDFIITREGKYIGVGKVNDLLRRITDHQIRHARYSNPLTMLPGNVPIYEWIDQLLSDKENFRLAYIDLNNFKPFNDTYGYSRGDEVLAMLGDILTSQAQQDVDLVGHVGGDDFVMIFRSSDWQQRCRNILARFDQEKRRFYSKSALETGGIWSEDRAGQSTFFGLLTIAIGVISPDAERCRSHHQVAQLASDAKHQAKSRGEGNNYIFLSRRRAPAESQFARHDGVIEVEQQASV